MNTKAVRLGVDTHCICGPRWPSSLQSHTAKEACIVLSSFGLGLQILSIISSYQPMDLLVRAALEFTWCIRKDSIFNDKF